MTEEKAAQQEELRVPPYYELFQEEREKRFSSEISRLETQIRHNGERIADLDKKVDAVRDELGADIARLDGKIDAVRDELKADIARLDGKIDAVRDELKADIARPDGKIDAVRDELKADIAELRREMQSQFRWMMGFLLPVTLGVVAILIQNLLKP
jgi:predicted  nucleic acid-binding Zn-ribbon protein